MLKYGTINMLTKCDVWDNNVKIWDNKDVL
jgi:hypothetical protein